MNESGYYPLGTEFSPDAPWNQHDNKGLEFEVAISQSLSKTTTVITTDYKEEEDYDDCLNQKVMVANTEDTDWNRVYTEQHYTPIELINILRNYLKNDIEHNYTPLSLTTKENLIKECENWIEDETEVIEE